MPALGDLDYYRIAQDRIGQYDSYCVRCRHWVAAVVAAVVAAAFRWPTMWWKLGLAGTTAVISLFLVEMTYRSVAMRLAEYAKKLEDRIDPRRSGGTESDAAACDLRFAHYMACSVHRRWCQFMKDCVRAGGRPGSVLFYLLTLPCVWLVLWLASLVSPSPTWAASQPAIAPSSIDQSSSGEW